MAASSALTRRCDPWQFSLGESLRTKRACRLLWPQSSRRLQPQHLGNGLSRTLLRTCPLSPPRLRIASLAYCRGHGGSRPPAWAGWVLNQTTTATQPLPSWTTTCTRRCRRPRRCAPSRYSCHTTPPRSCIVPCSGGRVPPCVPNDAATELFTAQSTRFTTLVLASRNPTNPECWSALQWRM